MIKGSQVKASNQLSIDENLKLIYNYLESTKSNIPDNIWCNVGGTIGNSETYNELSLVVLNESLPNEAFSIENDMVIIDPSTCDADVSITLRLRDCLSGTFYLCWDVYSETDNYTTPIATNYGVQTFSLNAGSQQIVTEFVLTPNEGAGGNPRVGYKLKACVHESTAPTFESSGANRKLIARTLQKNVK